MLPAVVVYGGGNFYAFSVTHSLRVPTTTTSNVLPMHQLSTVLGSKVQPLMYDMQFERD